MFAHCVDGKYYTPTPLRALEKHIDDMPTRGSFGPYLMKLHKWHKELKELMAAVRERYRRD